MIAFLTTFIFPLAVMIEFLLSIFYFIIFCFIISKISFFKDSKIPRHWFITAFGVKVLVSILLTIIYTKYYTDRSTADIFKYFDDSKIMFDTLKTKPMDFIRMLFGIENNMEYFNTNYYHIMVSWAREYDSELFSDTHVLIRFNTLIRFFSFGYFQVHNIFINFISLVGLALIFKAFKPFLLNKEKALFYILFFIPSILFWGSGLLKESFIFFALGLLFFNLFKIVNQFKFTSILLILLSLFLITYTKFYLLITLFIPISGYLINHYIKTKKPIRGYLLSSFLFLLAIYIAPIINSQLDFVAQIANKQQVFSRFVLEVTTNSGFLLPELTNGTSILINIPNALLNTFVRPFLWECNSIFVWLSAFENIAVIICIIIAIFYRRKMASLQKNIFYFNIIFVFSLFSLIGLTTPVFGAIMRYKIPGLILLLISLLLLVDLEKIKLKHPFLNKIL